MPRASAGRPVGSENKDKPFREALRMEIAAAGPNLKKLRQIAKKLLDQAAKGNVRASALIADRLDGKAMQAVEVTGEDGGPIITAELTTAERARALAAFIAKVKAKGKE